MCIGIMNSSKKLLNLIGIIAIGSFSFQKVKASDDLDDTLKQAIFLVKLLKTDFAQVLRANKDIVANSTEEEDANSTCSLPSEDFNYTMAIHETEVTGPSGRRMMPDYYYYDPPYRSGGQFRRFNNDPTADLSHTSATSQAQTTSSLPSVTSEATTTSSLPSVTSEATTVHAEDSTASTTSLSTTKGQPSTSILPGTNLTNQSLLTTANSTNQSIVSTAKSTKQSILQKTKESNLPKFKPSTLKTKPRKRVRQKKRVPKPKARTIKKSKRVRNHHLRHDTNNIADTADTADTATTKTITTHEVEMSQVAIELEEELEHSEDEHIMSKIKNNDMESTTNKRKKATTMKIFLKSSSRMPIPFPENNGFCHFHPESSLCGAN